jgi:hypothetical protein
MAMLVITRWYGFVWKIRAPLEIQWLILVDHHFPQSKGPWGVKKQPQGPEWKPPLAGSLFEVVPTYWGLVNHWVNRCMDSFSQKLRFLISAGFSSMVFDFGHGSHEFLGAKVVWRSLDVFRLPCKNWLSSPSPSGNQWRKRENPRWTPWFADDLACPVRNPLEIPWVQGTALNSGWERVVIFFLIPGMIWQVTNGFPAFAHLTVNSCARSCSRLTCGAWAKGPCLSLRGDPAWEVAAVGKSREIHWGHWGLAEHLRGKSNVCWDDYRHSNDKFGLSRYSVFSHKDPLKNGRAIGKLIFGEHDWQLLLHLLQ